MEETPTEERVRQFFFIVRGDDDDRTVLGFNRLTCLVDMEGHFIELLQQIIRKLDIGFVHFVDQQHESFIRGESFPEFSRADVVFHIVDAFITELTVASRAAPRQSPH